MLKFLLGVAVGVMIGVLVIAPQPDLNQRVTEVWRDTLAWFGTAAERAGEVVEDVAGDVQETGEQAADRVEELGQDAQ